MTGDETIKNWKSQLRSELAPSGAGKHERVGIEIEFFAFDASSLIPIGLPSTKLTPQSLLEKIHFYWKGSLKLVDHETGVLTGVQGVSGSSFTLEPGGQLEYSSAPCGSVDELIQLALAEFQFLEKAANQELLFLGHGTNPLAGNDHPLLVPKARYLAMTNYMTSQSDGRGLDMMRRTASIQPNVDVFDFKSWQESVKLIFQLGTFLEFLFQNSSFLSCNRLSHQNERTRIWKTIDSTRTGVPNGIITSHDVLESYIEWAFDANVMLISQLSESEQPRFSELTFRRWIEVGYKGVFPNYGDLQTHLSTLFPELRIRRFLEIRTIDTQPFRFAFVPVAIMSQILQCDDARRELLNYLKVAQQENFEELAELVFKLTLRGLEEANQPSARKMLIDFISTRESQIDQPKYDDAREFVVKNATPNPSVDFAIYL